MRRFNSGLRLALPTAVITTILITGSLGFGAVTSVALTTLEKAVLAKWGSLKQGKGVLLTPPRGHIAERPLAARRLIETIVNNIAGKDLKAIDAHVVINLYANDEPNAWVQQFDAATGAEAIWVKDHPGVSWPVRQWLGFANDHKPIYEIAVTTGLLRTIDTEGELAFILGHELTHLFEGHTDRVAGQEIGKWWSSQANETVADNGGIDRILGKYELSAATSALVKIHDPKGEAPPGGWRSALGAAESDHHHEGVRISMAQFYIEFLRRSTPEAQPIADKKLPTTIHASTAGRVGPKDSLSVEVESRFFAVIEKYFLTGTNYEYLTNNTKRYDVFKKTGMPDSLEDIWHAGGYEAVAVDHLLGEAIAKIERSTVSAAHKVNAFILTLALIQRYSPEKLNAAIEAWTPDQVSHVTRWLAENSVGFKGWKPKELVPSLGQMLTYDEKLLANIFMSSKNGQRILNSLSETIPSWKTYFLFITDPLIYSKAQTVRTNDIAEMLADVSAWPASKLRDRYLQSFIEGLRQIPKVKLFDEILFKGYHSFPNLIIKMKDISKEYKQKLKPDFGFGDYSLELEEKLARSLALADAKSAIDREQSLENRFSALLEWSSAVQRPITSDEYETFRQPFIQFANDLGRESSLEGLFPYLRGGGLEVAAHILVDPRVKENDKTVVFKMINALQSPTFAFDFADATDDGGRGKKIRTDLQSYFNTMSDDQLVDQITSHLRSTLSTLEREENRAKNSKNGSNGPIRFLNFSVTLYADEVSSGVSMIQELGLATRIQNLNIENLGKVVLAVEEAVMRVNGGEAPKRHGYLNRRVTDTLLLALVKHVGNLSETETWLSGYVRILKLAGDGYLLSADLREPIRKIVESKIGDLPIARSVDLLGGVKDIRDAVSAEYLSNTLTKFMKTKLATSARLNDIRLTAELLMKATDLKDGRPDAYTLFRAEVVQVFNLQPDQVNTVFPIDPRSKTEQVNAYRTKIRGLSGLVALTREQSNEAQLEMIDYLMARRDRLPDFVVKIEKESERRNIGGVSLANTLQLARRDLFFRSPLERSFVVNSVLSGPTSMIAKKEGLEAVVAKILAPVSAANRDVSKALMNGLLASEGSGKSFLLSYILSQKPMKENGGLTEVLVLRSLLDGFGVPGIKLGQYLAFSAEFKDYEAALESYQDAAMPLNEYDVLQLIRERLGDRWDPAKMRVTKAIGFGSVNVAIEYEDLETYEKNVVSLSRSEIETKTVEDFRRFRSFITELSKDPKYSDKFQFLVGLTDIIQRSVTLEFDKAHAFEMQKMAESLYNRDVKGWKVRTVKAYDVVGMGLFMQKAPGRGARKILHEQPEVYKEAMSALLAVEFDNLRGAPGGQSARSIPIFANPDVHDGQVLIESETKTVTIIDFGQAISISTAERELGVDILRVASGAESFENSMSLIKIQAKKFGIQDFTVSRHELGSALAHGERMDVFVHLISLLERSGFTLPLSSVHWVLGANRAIVLGQKTGVSVEAMFRNLILAKKMGVSVDGYNRIHDSLSSLKNTLGSWFGAKDSVSRSENMNQMSHSSPVSCEMVFSGR